MAPDLFSTLLGWLETLAPAFTKPSFTNAVILLFGWVQTSGVHAVTQALVATGVAGRRHHEAFHRFFSRGTWSPDAMVAVIDAYDDDADQLGPGHAIVATTVVERPSSTLASKVTSVKYITRGR